MKGPVESDDDEETDESPPERECLWTRQQVAAFLKVAPRTTYLMRLPTIYLTQRTVRFDPADIKRWLAERMTGSHPRSGA